MRFAVHLLGHELLVVEVGGTPACGEGPVGVSVEGADTEIADEVPFGFAPTDPIRTTVAVPESPRHDDL